MKVDFWFELSSTGDLGGWNLAWLKNSLENFILALSLEFGKSACFSFLFFLVYKSFWFMAQNLNKNSNCVSFGFKSIQKAMVSNQLL